MKYAKLGNTSFFQIVGRDSNKFINGLMTSKFLNQLIEKNNPANVLINDNSFYINKDLFFDNTENLGYKKLGLYTLFLNSKGRLLSDAWIYPLNDGIQYQATQNIGQSTFLPKKDCKHSSYLIEVHSNVLQEMAKMFKAHKIVSKVDLKQIDSSLINNWYIYPENEAESTKFAETIHYIKQEWLKNNDLLKTPAIANEKFLEFLKSKSLFKTDDISFLINNVFGIGIDERFPEASLKLITSRLIGNPFDILNDTKELSLLNSDSQYTLVSEKELEFRRCINDIPEIQDLEPNKYIPIELNYNLMAIENEGIDEAYEQYLNKLDEASEEELSSIEEVTYSCDNSPIISFNKGCYQGQELTHRSFFTGEIRKRYLPLKTRISSSSNSDDSIANEKITTELLKNLKDYNIYFDDFNKEPEEAEKSTNIAANPFGSSPVALKRKSKAGKLAHVSDNGYVTGIINLTEFTKPNRVFYLKVEKSSVTPDLQEQISGKLSGETEESQGYIKLYVEGYLPSWFPAGWNE